MNISQALLQTREGALWARPVGTICLAYALVNNQLCVLPGRGGGCPCGVDSEMLETEWELVGPDVVLDERDRTMRDRRSSDSQPSTES